MVHAFFVQTLQSSTCRVLHASHFGMANLSNGNAEVVRAGDIAGSAAETSPEASCEPRVQKKEYIALVARQVQSEYTFRKTVSDRAPYPLTYGMSIDDMMFDSEFGSFRLSGDNSSQNEQIAVWLGVAGTGFTLICDKHENRQQAESVLKLLARYFQEHIQALTQQENVMLKSDKVATIVHYFLPCGRLLFMNHTVIKQIEKNMELKLRAK